MQKKKINLENNLHYIGIEELIEIELGLKNYNLDLVKKMSKKLKITSKTKILDFGAGSGSLAEIWRDNFKVLPICIEIDPNLTKILNAKGFKTYKDIRKVNETFDYIYTSNVLEHIKDDIAVLKKLKELIRPAGLLAIYVPALPFLYSDLDRKVGHFRRYRKRDLINKVEGCGFLVLECYYNDSIGILASLALKIFGYKNKIGLGSVKSLKFYDAIIYPISIFLDRTIFKKIIGKNILLIAQNKS